MSEVLIVPFVHGGHFMSPDEQREQKARVLLEYQEVENEINALEVSAKTMGEDIVSFGNLMQMGAAERIFRQGQAHHGVASDYLPEKLLRTVREWEKCFDVADKLRQAYSRLDQLRQQKAKLGLR